MTSLGFVPDFAGAGAPGKVPDPGTSTSTHYLRDDGTFAVPPGTGMSNPMTTAADLIVGGSSGTPARLAKGADGQVLTVDPTTHLLVWATPASGSGSVTTKGDLQGYDSAANRIPIGSDNTFLRALASQALGLKWDTLAASDIPSLAASKITSGQLAQAQGGTGKDTSAATDGQVLIGKTSDHSLNLATLAAGANVTITNGAGSITIAAATALAASPYVHVQEQQTSGTAGGTFTSGAWRTRVLTTIVTDSGSISSLASNKITLPAGTYQCFIRCPAAAVNQHQARLWNNTDSAVLLTGGSQYAPTGAPAVANDAMIVGQFTLGASKDLLIQHQGTVTQAGNGFGVAGSFGTEVYTVAEFWKVA